MNFGEDPLADLLSDNSLDNDGFFENPAGKRPIPRMNKNATKLDDLFGIKEESGTTKTLPVPKARQPTPAATSNLVSTPRPTTQQSTQSKLLTEDDDDDLGFDPQKPKAGGSKLNLLDDLFASSSTSETRRPTTALPATGRRDTDRPAISRQSTDTTTETSNVLLTQQRPKTSAGRRSSSASNVMTTDPLGLFGGQVKERERDLSTSGISTPNTRKRGTTADWLGLSAEPEVPSKSETTADSPQRTIKALTTTTSTGRENVEMLKITDNVAEDAPDTNELELHENALNAPQQVSAVATGNSTAQNILLLNTHQMEMKNAYTALQQQESQLTLAAQMKNQERVLMDMQRKQEALLQQQERQFQGLMQQQLQRQQQMEEHIKMQQQRINTHIQLLMSQPALLAPMTLPPTTQMHDELGERMGSPDGTPDKSEDVKAVLRGGHSRNHSGSRSRSHSQSRPNSPQNAMLETVKLEADMKRLELEKLRLEELVANQKVNYESEIELIERSYKKQLEMVEHHAQSIETRLKAELDELTKHYTQKFESLENEKQKLKSDYDSDFSTLKQDHDDELRKLKKSHEDDLEMLKEEHRRMLESVRQSKMLEFAALQENGSYMEILKAASSNLQNLSGDLQGLRDDMQSRLELLHKEKEKKLEARERRVEDAERRLKLHEDSADEEKKRLMTLVASLEQQLNKLSKDSAEENWQLRQRMASLEAEKAAFEKEKEFAREQIARDEKHLAELKEQQLAESQRAALELQEERARIYLERTKIETERQLHSDHDLEKQRLEMDAVMKVAQDAARQADAERERYHKSLRQLEQQKRELIDKENVLRAKEDELQQETLAFRMAEHKSQEAQQRARAAEQNFQMKIQHLQQRMRELGEKEVNLTQDRMMLTQERISLEQLKTRLMEKRCALCKMGEQREKVVQFLSGHDATQIVGGEGGVRASTNDMAASTAANQNLNSVLSEPPTRDSRAAEERKVRHMLEQANIVDRMLDENIAESYRKMRATTSMEYWPEMVLDDDAKEQALNYLDNGVLRANGEHDLFNRNPSNKYQ